MILKRPLAATQFHIGDVNLPEVSATKDLGVTVDSNMKFSLQISNIARKANTRAKLILKCFHSRDTQTLLRAFTTYVRPTLEYNSPVWSPHFIKDINLLESAQRRFTKRLPGMYDKSYDDRLSLLQLERLETRRIRVDLITALSAYKILFGHTIIDFRDLNFPF